ncbi:UNVERIFIED_CONTAM: ER membrane complex subunit 6 [Siphonaria sp. JEL0065]|nr:ER membrane complex subunit 6 [Siphonaria sp. JEL0065]
MQQPAPVEEEVEIKYNPISPAAMQKNNHIILYARSTLALSCGAAAGILGLTGTYGFIFFFLASVAMSLALVVKTGLQPDRYFPINNGLVHVATAEVLNSLFSYMLFWTLFTGLVHLFE